MFDYMDVFDWYDFLSHDTEEYEQYCNWLESTVKKNPSGGRDYNE